MGMTELDANKILEEIKERQSEKPKQKQMNRKARRHYEKATGVKLPTTMMPKIGKW